jgi:hypothetical protein
MIQPCQSVTRNFWPAVLIAIALIFTGAGLSGCGTAVKIKKGAKNLTRKANPFSASDSGLRRKVGVARLQDRTHYPPDAHKWVQERFTDAMRAENAGLLLVGVGDIAHGRIDNLALADSAKRQGLSAVVTGAITEISTDKEETGFLWFTDVSSFLRVVMMISVYDPETGAKMLDDSFVYHEEISVDDAKVVAARQPVKTAIVDEALRELADEAAEAVADVIADQPWKTFIIAVDGERLAIPSGEDVGLKTGRALFVFNTLRVIDGLEGHRYYVPGNQLGAVRLTEVGKERSIAVASEKGQSGFAVGQTLKAAP